MATSEMTYDLRINEHNNVTTADALQNDPMEVDADTSTVNDDRTSTRQANIDDYMTNLLPKLGDKRYYTPYFVGELLSKHVVTMSGNIRISKFTIMNYFIEHKMVPVGKNTLYKIDSLVAMGILPQDATWTEIGQYGRKAILSPREIAWLINDIKLCTRGGEAISSNELKDKIQNYIFSVYSKKGKLFLLPYTISERILNSLVSTIKSQCVFDIYSSVGNKTEARIVAEWSLRSTLAYTMVVACNHFLPNVATTYDHPRKKGLSNDAVMLWDIAEGCYNKLLGNKTNMEKLHPVLPNLITTTDEVTIFATASEVHSDDAFYLLSKPEELKNENVDSGKRNHYKKVRTGNSHCRGVRIVVNATFTAGGISAPIFVSVYGLTREEIPNNDIITIEVPGLVAGSNQNLYSGGSGYVLFICGSEELETNDTEANISDPSYTTTQHMSKESQVANIYRQKVYYPFIRKIREDKYLYSGSDDDVPDFLTAVSWMDGCCSQLKLITSESNMMYEKKMKIRCCKHSAARTAVEQAADTGCMFKLMKKIINEAKNPHACNNSIYAFLDKSISSLESRQQTNLSSKDQVLNLLSHKKKPSWRQ